jgi:hypothetical protein
MRRAGQVEELHKQAGIYENPIEAWFDTLRLHTLPIQAVDADVERIGGFVAVPASANENFGYDADAQLKAMALPSIHHRRVILLCDMQDSISPSLYVYTMDKKYHPIDMLCIFHQEDTSRETEKGQTYNEYFITSNYEITVMRYFKGRESAKTTMEEARRYTINQDGMFEELPIVIE